MAALTEEDVLHRSSKRRVQSESAFETAASIPSRPAKPRDGDPRASAATGVTSSTRRKHTRATVAPSPQRCQQPLDRRTGQARKAPRREAPRRLPRAVPPLAPRTPPTLGVTKRRSCEIRRVRKRTTHAPPGVPQPLRPTELPTLQNEMLRAGCRYRHHPSQPPQQPPPTTGAASQVLRRSAGGAAAGGQHRSKHRVVITWEKVG